MTTTLRATDDRSAPGREARVRRWLQPAAAGALRQGVLTRHPAWPVAAMLVGYPIWWALGIADFVWILMAAPMAARMIAWTMHGTRRIRVPPGFGMWLLFLLASAAGVMMLTLTAPGTIPSPVTHRVLSYGDRMLTYVGVTVLLLYVGNLTQQELPRRRLAWMLGLIAIFATIGGLAGMAEPNLQLSSPILHLIPQSVRSNSFIQASMHPGLSQVQNVLGTAKGRPKAPFDYTNTWGDALTITVPWLIVGWWATGGKRQRIIAAAAIATCILPMLYSLNRTSWIGAALSVGYLAVRLAAKGKLAMLGGVCAALALVGILVLATPLQGLISGRLANGKSDHLRSNLAGLTLEDAWASPIIGFGDTRQQQGSGSSIAVGPTPDCPKCGQQAVGSTGQLWLLLVCSGYTGAVLYLGFFAYGTWRYRRDDSPYGMAGTLVLLLGFLYMFTYDAVGAPLGFTVLAYAVLWRNDTYLRDNPEGGPEGGTPDESGPGHPGPGHPGLRRPSPGGSNPVTGRGTARRVTTAGRPA